MLLTWQAVFNISDNTITSLLLCLRHFMWLIGNCISSDVLSSFADMIPKTLHSLRELPVFTETTSANTLSVPSVRRHIHLLSVIKSVGMVLLPVKHVDIFHFTSIHTRHLP